MSGKLMAFLLFIHTTFIIDTRITGLKLVFKTLAFLETDGTSKDIIKWNSLALGLGTDIITVADIDGLGAFFFTTDNCTQKEIKAG